MAAALESCHVRYLVGGSLASAVSGEPRVGRSPIDRTQMDRRQRVRIATDPEAWIYVYTPEDILLQRALSQARGD